MDCIQKNTEEIKKIALQMTGLVTLMSVGGSTPDKMKSLHKMYSEVEECTSTILSQVNKIIEYNDNKQKSMRKDLAAAKKRSYQLQDELEKSESEVKKLKTDMSYLMDDSSEMDASLPQTSSPIPSSSAACSSQPVLSPIPSSSKESREEHSY